MSLKFLLLESIHASADPVLLTMPGAAITRLDYAPKNDELLELVQDANVLGVRSRTQLTREVLQAASQLKAIGSYCTGTNNIDREFATQQGIAMFNGPFSNTRSVAELVIGHSIHLLRRIPERDSAAKRGGWLKDARGSNELRGKVLGIIGYGKIGTQVGLLAESIGMRVVYHDIEARLPLGNARPAPSLRAMLAESDVVTLHVPQTSLTKGLMTAERFAQMKQGAVFLNLARGTAVDIDALYESLKSDHLRGAAIDVFPVEPSSPSEAFESPLRELDNVILTPHIGGSTEEAQRNLGVEVSEKLRDYFVSGAIHGSVNLPELSMGAPTGADRLVHIHHDRPGVMSQLNTILSEAGLNVSQLHLATQDGVGVAAVDVSQQLQPNVLQALRGIDGSIRVFTVHPASAA